MIQVVNCLHSQSDASHQNMGGRSCLNGGEDQGEENKNVANFPSALLIFRVRFLMRIETQQNAKILF